MSAQLVFCPCCEHRTAMVIDQEPYGDGKRFRSTSCAYCGWAKIERDDLCPENVGREHRPPANGTLNG